jgi:hypothetical protein
LAPDGYLVFVSESSPNDPDSYVLLADVSGESSYLHQSALVDTDKSFYLICAYLDLDPELRRLISSAETRGAVTMREFFQGSQK